MSVYVRFPQCRRYPAGADVRGYGDVPSYAEFLAYTGRPHSYQSLSAYAAFGDNWFKAALRSIDPTKKGTVLNSVIKGIPWVGEAAAGGLESIGSAAAAKRNKAKADAATKAAAQAAAAKAAQLAAQQAAAQQAAQQSAQQSSRSGALIAAVAGGGAGFLVAGPIGAAVGAGAGYFLAPGIADRIAAAKARLAR